MLNQKCFASVLQEASLNPHEFAHAFKWVIGDTRTVGSMREKCVPPALAHFVEAGASKTPQKSTTRLSIVAYD